MHTAYLDNSATTMCCREAADKAYEAMTLNYGNPSSLHKMGITAEEYLRSARDGISGFISCLPEEIYFTSGGTEANNLLILGAARAMKKRGNRIITTELEHPSVINTFLQLEKEGFEVVFLKPDSSGTVPESAVRSAVDKNTVLISMMLVNNETGAFLPVEAIRRAADSAGSRALIHCDAVQAFGKLPIKLKRLGVDLLSASGHKIHAPKGSGFAYIRKGVHINPVNFGGGQESGIRSGTQATPQIAGLCEAVRLCKSGMSEYAEQVSELKKDLTDFLSELPGAVINSPENSSPYILNFSVPGIRSEIMLHSLEENGVYVSAGSACSKGKKSHVLSALGLSPEIADSAIRVSFSRYNTKEDTELLKQALQKACTSLRHS